MLTDQMADPTDDEDDPAYDQGGEPFSLLDLADQLEDLHGKLTVLAHLVQTLAGVRP